MSADVGPGEAEKSQETERVLENGGRLERDQLLQRVTCSGNEAGHADYLRSPGGEGTAPSVQCGAEDRQCVLFPVLPSIAASRQVVIQVFVYELEREPCRQRRH